MKKSFLSLPTYSLPPKELPYTHVEENKLKVSIPCTEWSYTDDMEICVDVVDYAENLISHFSFRTECFTRTETEIERRICDYITRHRKALRDRSSFPSYTYHITAVDRSRCQRMLLWTVYGDDIWEYADATLHVYFNKSTAYILC